MVSRRRNLTVQLDEDTIDKARVVAARKGMSISRFVALTIDRAVAEDARCGAAERQALAFLEQGFEMGGTIRASRDEWHER